MYRFDSVSGDASGFVERHMSKAGMIAASILLGALLVWVLVRPLAPQVDEAVLFSRFALFCFSHAILFCGCEWMASTRAMLFSPLVGPTAAAVTASMYLQVGGIPSEMILLAITFFLLGFHGFAAIHAPEEARAKAVSKMLYSMSLSTVLFAAPVLLVAVLNCLMAGGLMSSGAF